MMDRLALAERGVDASRFQNSSPLSSLLAKERGEETAAVALAFNISKTDNERTLPRRGAPFYLFFYDYWRAVINEIE
jgi:hypothetical protein